MVNPGRTVVLLDFVHCLQQVLSGQNLFNHFSFNFSVSLSRLMQGFRQLADPCNIWDIRQLADQPFPDL